MNEAVRNRAAAARIGYSACPHDCPSTCALEVEVLDEHTIGRVRGARDNDYTAGVICAKVARYAERIHHPDRVTRPLVRKGAKDSGRFEPISWNSALDLVATFAGQASDMNAWLPNAAINADRNLRLQYLAGGELNRTRAGEILRALIASTTAFPERLFAGTPVQMEELRQRLAARGGGD